MVKSPRWVRPHTVTVTNVLPEVDGEEQTSTAKLEYVKVEDGRKASFGQTGRAYKDTVSIVIDMNDLVASKAYKEPLEFTDPDTQFTLRPGDRVTAEGREWEITAVRRVNPLRSAPEFIEVTAE